MVPGHDLPALAHRFRGGPPAADRHAPRADRARRLHRRRGRRRRRVQGRLHRPGHRVPEGSGPARAALPGAVGHAGHARVQRCGPREGQDRFRAEGRRAPTARRVGRQAADVRGRSHRLHDRQLRPDRHRPRRLGARAAGGGDRRPAQVRHPGRHVRRADRRRRHRRVPDRRAGRARHRGPAADRRPAQPARGGQRALRRARGRRARLRRAAVGGLRDRRARAWRRRSPGCSASAPASTTRCCSPPASRRSCAAAARRSRPRRSPTRPPATPPSPPPASCSSRSPACS